MQTLLRLSGVIDRISWIFGIIASGFVLLSCAISAGNATSRYLFDISSNAWLEVQWQMFAGIFLLGAPWVLKLNGHVRVDLIYGGLSTRGKAWVDVFGLIFFLFPVCFVMIRLSLPWVETAILRGEMSSNAGGLPVWPVKVMLPLGFGLLALQGFAELIRRIAALRGEAALDLSYERPIQ